MVVSAEPKREVIQLIERLPDDCTLEDILYQLHFKRKVDEGLAALEQGRILTTEEARQRLAHWLK